MTYNSALDRYPLPSDNGGCASRADVVTPSDSTDFSVYYTSLYVGVSGDLTVIPVRNASDVGILYKGVAVGFFPVAVRRVLATGTTATNIVGQRD